VERVSGRALTGSDSSGTESDYIQDANQYGGYDDGPAQGYEPEGGGTNRQGVPFQQLTKNGRGSVDPVGSDELKSDDASSIWMPSQQTLKNRCVGGGADL
jgi:hypothetical protein